MKKDKGAIEYSFSFILLSMVVFVLLFCLRIRSAQITKNYVEDALAVANLSAAVIDTEHYGETEELIITDAEEAFEQFKQSLRYNLNLDSSYMPANTVLMENPVKILEFHIYNKEEHQIIHVVFDEHGNKSSEVMGISGAVTPNGKEIESTTIYSKIEFDVKGFLDQRFRATLDNSVDVIKN